MESDRRNVNPVWLAKRTWQRISGADARIWKQNASELSTRLEQEHRTTQELVAQLESRDRRIHPYVSEALSLVSNSGEVSRLVVAESAVGESNLGALFEQYGSDKQTRHSYGSTYESLLGPASQARNILEVGIGSVNAYAYAGLPPGGSLRAWREYYPKASVIGMDIDPESIAAVEQPAFVVDQTNQDSLDEVRLKLREFGQFDLIVDDGFHDPHANVRTLLTFFELLRPGGSYVVEDIHSSLIDFWCVVAENFGMDSYVLDLSAQRPDCDDNVLFVAKAPMV